MELTAILVDDEPMILDSILLGVNWGGLGVRVAATFTDGAKALEYVKKTPVSIVISDVSMPPFSGLVLCSQILQLRPATQFIIISGFADFAYAQKSLQFGAVGYCLKPIDYDELSGYIRKAIKRIVPQTKAVQQEFIEYLYENNVAWLLRHLTENRIGERFYVGVSIGASSLFAAQDGFQCALGLNETLYLSNRDLSGALSDRMLEDNGLLGFSSSGRPITCEQLQETVYQTLYDSYQFFFCPGQKLFQSRAEYQTGLVRRAKRAAAHPQELCQLLAEARINHIRLAAELYAIVQECSENESSLFSYNQLIYLYHDYGEMQRELLQLLQSQSAPLVEYESNNRKFLEMIRYINEHCMQDISIRVLADKLNLNMSYVSQLFKKETGTTFVKYLTGVRMERAKELLADTELSVNEISEACGYHDYFYFIKQFKRYASMTPTVYRKHSGAELGESPGGDEET